MNAIEFENISKQYRLGYVNSKTLSQDLNRWWTMNILRKEDPLLKIGETNDRTSKGDSEYVWALKNIDFKVEQGDVVGIIGKNGAGKSTLLKLLSRVTNPTTGIIRARGKIASLLEVGTGFHTELTGRENIYMNGAIMGMTKQEINSKLDEIIDFSGCERYIDTPVKRYSSGMMVRLGFAVAAHLEPEILVVDEVLAVGDAEFQKKAIGKMQDVSQGDGRTVLFVSHNMASIKKLCKNGVLLEKGQVSYTGKIKDVVERYIGGAFEQKQHLIFDDNHFVGNQYINIESIDIDPVSGKDITFDKGVKVSVNVRNHKLNSSISMSFAIFTADDVKIFDNDIPIADKDEIKDGLYNVEFVIPSYSLNKGKYRLAIWFVENQGSLLWHTFSHYFEIFDAYENSYDSILLTKLDSKVKFLGC